MKFILVANYKKDNQESMLRYTLNLRDNLQKHGVNVEIWYPIQVFGSLVNNTEIGFKKWIGYLDKWILGMISLKFKSISESNTTIFHICDHSNSPYLQVLPKSRSGITCHDVLAIQGAFGYTDAYCEASRIGILFQKWILKNLKKSNRIAAVSEYTLTQLLSLCNGEKPENAKWEVIYNTFNDDFEPMKADQKEKLLGRLGINKKSYILHVGSSLPRKNREMLLKMSKYTKNWDGLIVFAGAKIEPGLQLLINEMHLGDRVLSIEKPSHEELVGLYSGCLCFVFPSYSEGFGWPLIEAQACHAAVLASNKDPMPEVSGGAAIHKDPANPEEFAEGLDYLLKPDNRNYYIKEGIRNCARFDTDKIINAFINLYN